MTSTPDTPPACLPPDLLPCPSGTCIESILTVRRRHRPVLPWVTWCVQCGWSTGGDDTEEASHATWNRRTRSAEVEALRARVAELVGEREGSILVAKQHKARVAELERELRRACAKIEVAARVMGNDPDAVAASTADLRAALGEPKP